MAYHILGCDKNKDSFFIYYHILTFGKFLPKYEGKACRFLHTNSKLLPLISDKNITIFFSKKFSNNNLDIKNGAGR